MTAAKNDVFISYWVELKFGVEGIQFWWGGGKE